MINVDLVDEIIIVTQSNDEWGTGTETESDSIKAKIEDVQKYVKNKDGQELLANTLIIIDKSNTISWDNKIKIKKRFGSEITESDKQYPIKSLSLLGGFTESHYEVYI